jgi:hypothetical protein
MKMAFARQKTSLSYVSSLLFVGLMVLSSLSWGVGSYDFGDAPDPTYPTLLASSGARHLTGLGVYLGSAVDSEADGQPTAGADGDDVTDTDDEDGVAFASGLEAGGTSHINVTASATGTLSAWIDFNTDGDWADAGEDIFPGGQALTAGVNALNFDVPADAILGDTFARFRFSTDGALSYTGYASDGEVEDYRVTIGSVSSEAPADWDGGGGGPYSIASLKNLRWLSETTSVWGDDFVVTQDIDASPTQYWNMGNHDDDDGTTPEEPMGFGPIGRVGIPFSGSFDGQGHTIGGLTINRPAEDYVGLFGVAMNAVISNVILDGVALLGEDSVGGVVGFADLGAFTSCQVTGTVEGVYEIGGFAGTLYDSTVSSCQSSGAVFGQDEVGGLIGYAVFPETTILDSSSSCAVDGIFDVGGLIGMSYEISGVENCYATGAVTGWDWYVGGLIGWNDTGTVQACYATGDVSGLEYAGGLIGYNYGAEVVDCRASGDVSAVFELAGGLVSLSDDGSTLRNCVATGVVSGENFVGGLVGVNFLSDIDGCYAMGDVSGLNDVGGLAGVNDGDGMIVSSYATGTVFSDFEDAGGLVAWNSSGFIAGCYATGAVSGTTAVGGLVGYNSDTIMASYATGAVSGATDVGGFVGWSGGFITSCYWDTRTTGLAKGIGTDVGSTTITAALTSTEMVQQASYDANWDFATTPDWAIIDGATRPYLPWQAAVLHEGATSMEGTTITLQTGYVHNPAGSGVTLDEYGVAHRVDGAVEVIYQAVPGAALAEDEGAALDGTEITGLVEGEIYWARAYALDSDGNLHVGTERKATYAPSIVQAPGPLVVTMDEDGDPTTWVAPTLTATDFDADDAALTWRVSAAASHGMATVSGMGAAPTTFTYAPDADYHGADSFDVQVTDADGGTDTITVDVTIEPVMDASEVTTWPIAAGLVYGATLADCALTGGEASVPGVFAFDAPATVPDLGTASYELTFTPTDIINFSSVAGTVSVTVVQATPEVTAWPTVNAITYGDTLTDEHLVGGEASTPGTFAFAEATLTPDAGTLSISVIFTPTDSTYYSSVEGSVTVTIAQAMPVLTAWPTAGSITYGQDLTEVVLTGGEASVPGSFHLVADTPDLDAGIKIVSVVFTPTDSANYLTIEGSVAVVIMQGTPQIIAWPTASNIFEGDSLSTSRLFGSFASVPGTFAFDAPETIPEAGTYTAAITFTPDDTANYISIAGTIELVVLAASEGEGEGETPVEGEGEAPAEGEGEVPAEGEGETPAEGEGETPAEGEGEPPAEGEGEPPAEGEGETPAEGEGEMPAEGEGEAPEEGEGETPAEGEGEGETPAEGEGETPAEGEGETSDEGEGEGEPAEVCTAPTKGGDWRMQLGDWMGLLIGLSAMLVARRGHALTRRKK